MQKGYLITFYTQQGRTHGKLSIAEWLVKEAMEAGVGGATVSQAAQGYGRDGKLHSAHFFELTEQPMEVHMAASFDSAERLLTRIREEKLRIFYTRTPVEFGTTCEKYV